MPQAGGSGTACWCWEGSGAGAGGLVGAGGVEVCGCWWGAVEGRAVWAREGAQSRRLPQTGSGSRPGSSSAPERGCGARLGAVPA